jgi:hypothetical protein
LAVAGKKSRFDWQELNNAATAREVDQLVICLKAPRRLDGKFVMKRSG